VLILSIFYVAKTSRFGKGRLQKMKKRILAIVLALLMALTMIGGIAAYLFR